MGTFAAIGLGLMGVPYFCVIAPHRRDRRDDSDRRAGDRRRRRRRGRAHRVAEAGADRRRSISCAAPARGQRARAENHGAQRRRSARSRCMVGAARSAGSLMGIVGAILAIPPRRSSRWSSEGDRQSTKRAFTASSSDRTQHQPAHRRTFISAPGLDESRNLNHESLRRHTIAVEALERRGPRLNTSNAWAGGHRSSRGPPASFEPDFTPALLPPWGCSAQRPQSRRRRPARCFGKPGRSRECATPTCCRSTAWTGTTGGWDSGATSCRARTLAICSPRKVLGPARGGAHRHRRLQGGWRSHRRGIAPPRHRSRQRDARGGRPNPADGFRTHRSNSGIDERSERHARLYGAGAPAAGSRRRSPATIYAIGVLLFNLLTGVAPVEGANPRRTARRPTPSGIAGPHSTCGPISPWRWPTSWKRRPTRTRCVVSAARAR